MSAKRSMLYTKLFFTYLLVIICLIGGFDIYLVNYVMSDAKTNRIDLGEKLVFDVSEFLKEVENSNKFLVNTVYFDDMLTKDIINFLHHSTNDYLKYKLDAFADSNQVSYGGVEKFIANAFISNDVIQDITLLSKTYSESRTFNRMNQITTNEIKTYDEIIEKVPNLFFQDDKLYYVNALNNPDTLAEEGKLIIGYSLARINQIVSNYGETYQAFVLDENRQIMYMPNQTNSQLNQENIADLIALQPGKEYKLQNLVSVIKNRFTNNLSVGVEMSMTNLIETPKLFYSSLVLLDIALIIVTLGILKSKLEKLTRRTDNILQAMAEVKAGNLRAQIPIDQEADELSYISEHFNEMCIDLENYIRKSYLAEINQKKAEMIALQNQINPHFLYNTLECIRMKALCNGDKEVGKMLYNLSFLFRKQVKDNHLITLQSELEYCERYMEIFKFRYRDKFDFEIYCPEEFEDNEMIKFTIQPLIENYFVHGIKLDESDNFIAINVIKEDDVLKVIIDDNGKGINESKLEELNNHMYRALDENLADRSIGIINAQERIVGTYGKKYGIELGNNSKGARIVITIPCKRGTTYEKSHVSG